MAALLAAANAVAIDFGGDDDIFDKLSRQYSVVLLVVFCVIVSTNQYAGHPINCWVPATFTPSMRDYADSLCWVKNTYYAPSDGDPPMRDDDVKQSELNYYQWVPIMLALQALMFYSPYMAWRALNSRVGCDLKNVVKLLTDATMLNQDVHDKAIRFATVHIDKFLVSRSRKSGGTRRRRRPEPRHQRTQHQKQASFGGGGGGCGDGDGNCRDDGDDDGGGGDCCSNLAPRSGSHIVAIYALTKVLYLANAVGQLFMLNAFLGADYGMYGLQVLTDLFGRRATAESVRFPRATLCSFKVREVGGNVHRHTVQCVLPVNLFNEKIYVFLWFWLALVAVLTFCSLASWTWAVTKMSRVALCRGYLRRAPGDAFAYGERDKAVVPRFADSYLRQDGAFIIRLLSKNVNSVVVSEIVMSLYDNYRKLHSKAGEVDDDDDFEGNFADGGGGVNSKGQLGHV